MEIATPTRHPHTTMQVAALKDSLDALLAALARPDTNGARNIAQKQIPRDADRLTAALKLEVQG